LIDKRQGVGGCCSNPRCRDPGFCRCGKQTNRIIGRQDIPSLIFTEQPCMRSYTVRWYVDLCAFVPSKGHFSDADTKAAIRDVVTSGNPAFENLGADKVAVCAFFS
jgi:hypothetical protein